MLYDNSRRSGTHIAIFWWHFQAWADLSSSRERLHALKLFLSFLIPMIATIAVREWGEMAWCFKQKKEKEKGT